jgi:hypothetical protein
VNVSRNAAPDNTRMRSTSTVGSVPSSPICRVTPVNAAESAPRESPRNPSGSRPLSDTMSALSSRRSWWNQPCTPSGRICPSGPESTSAGASTHDTRSCSNGATGTAADPSPP